MAAHSAHLQVSGWQLADTEASRASGDKSFMSRVNLSEWAVTHRTLVIFMMLIAGLGGLFAFSKLSRLEDPYFSVPVMTGLAFWPGATSQEVQDQVMNRLEQRIQEIPGFDNIQTFSRQGYGGFKVNMHGGMSGKELQDAWYQVRKRSGDARGELPEAVRGPMLNDEYNDVYAAIFALQAPGLNNADLNDLAGRLKRQYQAVPNVGKIDILGKQAEQAEISFSPQYLSGLGISPMQVYDAVQAQNRINPSGIYETPTDRVFVKVSGPYKNLDDIRNTTIQSASGQQLRLGDIAKVKYTTAHPPNIKMQFNGTPAVFIALAMQPKGNIIHFGEAVKAKTAEINQLLPLGTSLTQTANQAHVVEDSVWEFERSFLEALVIVLVVCLASLGWRTGIVVAASVPLVLGIVAIVMMGADWSLNRVTLGALIIALGLLVDDAIITIETMAVKMEEGWPRLKAATFAYTSTAFPMLTGTLLTVAGFMPVGFAKSSAGQYAGGIFWIVGTALVASWFVAVIFTPLLGVMMLPDMKQDHHGNPYDKPVYHRFERLLAWVINHKLVTIGGTVALFVVAVTGMQLVQQQFFPTASRPELLVELRMQEGASLEATEKEVQKLDRLLKGNPHLHYYSSFLGVGAPRFFLSLAPELPNPNYAQLVILSKSLKDREALRNDLIKVFADNRMFPSTRGRVSRLEFGPPVGFPVQFRIIGTDADKLRTYASQIQDVMAKSPYVYNVQSNWGDKARGVRINLDQDKIRTLGLSSTDVANTVQSVVSGIPVTEMRRNEETATVLMRANRDEGQNLSQLPDIPMFGRNGSITPLNQLATVEPTFDEPVLWRRNRELNITVMADPRDGIQANYASQQLLPGFKAIIDRLPAGYRIEMGGAIEESAKADVALKAVFPLMILTMLILLMVQLQSFSRMGIVLLTAPLGMIGVVPALLLFNAPFGFVALLGVIALAGMIMRNSLILVDQIDHNVDSGMPPAQAIIEATVRRARPVVLTALAAILAMIPLTRSIFWGPMAIAIMGGLIVATALTLLVVPALYAAWFRVGDNENRTSVKV